MSLTHEEVLAGIEQEVLGHPTRPEEVDGRIADALGVPVDYYLAYLLVARAVERYREQALRQQPLPAIRDLDAGGGPVERTQRLAESIGWAAAAIYRDTTGEGHREVNTLAAHIIAAGLQLRTNLRELDSRYVDALAPTPAPPTGGHVEMEPGVSLDD